MIGLTVLAGLVGSAVALGRWSENDRLNLPTAPAPDASPGNNHHRSLHRDSRLHHRPRSRSGRAHRPCRRVLTTGPDLDRSPPTKAHAEENRAVHGASQSGSPQPPCAFVSSLRGRGHDVQAFVVETAEHGSVRSNGGHSLIPCAVVVVVDGSGSSLFRSRPCWCSIRMEFHDHGQLDDALLAQQLLDPHAAPWPSRTSISHAFLTLCDLPLCRWGP
jgi:hypothetical protein